MDVAHEGFAKLPYGSEGARHLASGAHRVVLATCPEHVIKVSVDGDLENATEVETWALATPELREGLATIFAWSESWVLMDRVVPLGHAIPDLDIPFGRYIGDAHEGNLGVTREGRIVHMDYGSAWIDGLREAGLLRDTAAFEVS